MSPYTQHRSSPTPHPQLTSSLLLHVAAASLWPSAEEQAGHLAGQSLPLASLTVSGARVTAVQRTSSSVRAVRSVPALRASNATRPRLGAGSAHATQLSASSAETSTSSTDWHTSQPLQQGKGFKPWTLPLAAAALVFHGARSAARVSSKPHITSSGHGGSTCLQPRGICV